MSGDYLNRAQAPFAEALWQTIDAAVVDAARDLLTGRRFLELDGAYGVGLTAIEVGSDELRQDDAAGVAVVMGRVQPVAMLRKTFQLSIRRIAGHVENDQPLDLAAAEDAAEAVAAREEALIYRGEEAAHLPGLLTASGRHHVQGGDWSEVEQALRDVLAGVTRLDSSGFRGPYALALSPPLYNGLFRLYPGTDLPQLEHLRRLCTRGIFKAAIEGGVLVDPRVGVLILGQDLRTGYIGHDGIHYQLYASESVALRIDDPKAVCTLDAKHALVSEQRPQRRPAKS
jgi:uncharacterized linocin/CFP29 family protein